MPHILIVDDDPSLRSLMKLLLERRGHRVVAAADGAAALIQFKSSRPDLVVTDALMPGMGGLALAEAVASEDGGTRVILVTGDQDRERHAENELRRAGVRWVIPKPFSPVEFLQTIERALACSLDTEAPLAGS